MSHSFIGGYFLNPYIARFEEAVNLAAIQYEDERRQVVSVSPTQGPKKHYSLVRAKNVGYTAILLFARDPTRLQHIQEAEVGFGAAEMGNKGAAGLRTLYQVEGGQSTELTFVATHLAAMEWNLPRRNANWAAIMRGMTFENPEAILKTFSKGKEPEATSGDGNDGERTGLLRGHSDEEHLRLQRRIHDISVFRPSSHLFVAGDLNYRISTSSPSPYAAFPSLDPASENHYPKFLHLDQLTRERKAGRTLHGLTEAEIRFPPTYKYDILPQKSVDEQEVPWEFAPHRYPSWTDRVLYLDVPNWIKNSGKSEEEASIQVRAYDAMPVIRTSDHRPVFLRVTVPLISPDEMAPPPHIAEQQPTTPGATPDPRLRLPIEIDPEAWERRAAARRREVMAGWSMFLWSTRQGALILATLLAAGVGGYWLYQTA